MIFPDYDQSVLSIVSSVLQRFGATGRYPSLDCLKGRLGRKHVALLILDGLGEAEMRDHLPENAFLRKHRVRALTSVYPPTTTAATTSYYTGLSPIEHGWLGWSAYFKEYARTVELFTNRDFFTKESVKGSPATELMPFESIFHQIKGARTRWIFPFQPAQLEGADEGVVVHDFSALCARLRGADRAQEPSFTLAYWPEPDATQHEKGVSHADTRAVIRALDSQIAALCASLRDTALIVSADHGLIDVQTLNLLDYPDVYGHLIMTPTLEPRALSLFVKPGRHPAFERDFRAHFDDQFLLMRRAEVLESGLLGRGKMHPKADDFLGDYLACATGDVALGVFTPGGTLEPLIGQHAGLTEREMLVPLIAWEGEMADG